MPLRCANVSPVVFRKSHSTLLRVHVHLASYLPHSLARTDACVLFAKRALNAREDDDAFRLQDWDQRFSPLCSIAMSYYARNKIDRRNQGLSNDRPLEHGTVWTVENFSRMLLVLVIY